MPEQQPTQDCIHTRRTSMNGIQRATITTGLCTMQKEFLSFDLPQFQYLFYVWGHSYEFDRDNNWDVIEEFCKMIGGREDIWYATNAEVCHYLMAVKQVHTSVDEKLLFNGSGQDIYLIRNGENILLRPGELQRIHSPESHGILRKNCAIILALH